MKQIAIVGCGLGGAAITAMLQKLGFGVSVYEQAPFFSKLGAGIHLTPNVVKALELTGLASSLSAMACKPAAFVSRDAHTGKVIAKLRLGEGAIQRFGAPYFTVNRGDFHELMIEALRPSTVQFGKRLISLIEENEKVRLTFEDGTESFADIVIGADGLSSVVRNAVCENNLPHFSGQAAYRATIDLNQLGEYRSSLDDLTKWWSDERFIISYYMNSKRDQYYFVAGFPQEHWQTGVQSLPANHDELMACFADFTPEARRVLEAAQDVRKWPLYERPAEAVWSKGRIVLLGDACHPMRPHMAQGAAMAIEDGAVLARSLVAAGLSNWPLAFELYQKCRKDRVKIVQNISSENSWMRTTPDPSWLFELDAWDVPLVKERNL